jgi:hypothetical protein
VTLKGTCTDNRFYLGPALLEELRMSIYVVFFGGYRASSHDMHAWKASAQSQRSDVTFDAYPYPANAGSSEAAAVGGVNFEDMVERFAKADAEEFYIVGHSSGCAIANKLNELVEEDSRITLVDLDGFRARAEQKKRSTVQLWCAEGPRGKGQSVNWAADKKKYTASRATQPWSLHFSMVNTTASDAITLNNFAQTGYAGCMANLCWLGPA